MNHTLQMIVHIIDTEKEYWRMARAWSVHCQTEDSVHLLQSAALVYTWYAVMYPDYHVSVVSGCMEKRNVLMSKRVFQIMWRK